MVAVFAPLLFWLFASASIKDRLVGFVNPWTNERQCFNYQKKFMNAATDVIAIERTLAEKMRLRWLPWKQR